MFLHAASLPEPVQELQSQAVLKFNPFGLSKSDF